VAEVEDVEREDHRAAHEAVSQAHLLGEGMPQREIRR
jgi:hypothetical protein